MKKLPWIILVSVLATGGCRRSEPEKTSQEAPGVSEEVIRREAVLAAQEELIEAERLRLEVERERLEVAKEELRLRREAEMMAREGRAFVREGELDVREDDAVMREAEIAAREQALSEQELMLAGTDVIEDWTEDEPQEFQEPVADYDLFYEGLADTGEWYDTADYGYVYQPTVVIQNTSWRPYTLGRWVCSNLGWTWCSDEPFGWACYHYGRWTLLAGRGWCWVPGSEWAPSWVDWRTGGGHVGWAPLPPETMCYRKRGWGTSVGVDFGIGYASYNFMEMRHMGSPAWRHCLPVARNRDCLKWTRGCTNMKYKRNSMIAGGPRYAEIASKVKGEWPVYRLERDPVGGLASARARRGQAKGRELRMFTPEVDVAWNSGLKPERVKGRIDKVEVLRSEKGISSEYRQRFAETRSKQQTQAQEGKGRASAPAVRKELLVKNRELATARLRERTVHARRPVAVRPTTLPLFQENGGQTIAKRDASPQGATRNGGPVAQLPKVNRPEAAQVVNPRPEKLRPESGVRSLPGTVERNDRPAQPDAVAKQVGQRQDEAKKLSDAKAQMEQRRQQALRERSSADAQRRAREQASQEETRRAAEEQSRQQASRAQEQARRTMAERSSRQAAENAEREMAKAKEAKDQRSRAQAAERAQKQQEMAKRVAEERSRAQASDRARQQQDLAKRAAEERSRAQAAERAQQQQNQAKRAAEERSRAQAAERAQKQQEMAKRAAEERSRAQAADRARQQQDQARRAAEERSRSQAADRARQQQDQARRAAEERSRSQAADRARQQQDQARQAAQQRVREAAERARQTGGSRRRGR